MAAFDAAQTLEAGLPPAAAAKPVGMAEAPSAGSGSALRTAQTRLPRRLQRGPYSTLYMPPPPGTRRGAPPLPRAIVLGIASS
jgi:hypothetical protein